MTSFVIGQFTITTSSAGSQATLPPPSVMVQSPVKTIDVFHDLEQRCALRAQKYVGGSIKRVPGTRFLTVAVATETQRKKALEFANKQILEKQFLNTWGADSIVNQIHVESGSCGAKNAPEESKGAVNALSVRRKACKLKLHAVGDIENITRAIGNIFRKKGATIEIVGKHSVVTRYVRNNNQTYLKARVRHMEGIMQRRDIVMDMWCQKVIKNLITKTASAKPNKADSFGVGSSGLILLKKHLKGKQSSSKGDIFVIRGRYKQKLFDSQIKLRKSTCRRMIHYSSGNKFWDSFSSKLASLNKDTDHECSSDMDLIKCGRVAALVSHALFQCGKLTCTICKDQFMQMNREEFYQSRGPIIQDCIEQIDNEGPDFSHAARICKSFERFSQCYNGNFDAFSENKRMIGNRTEIPFKHLNTLNELLMKGALATKEELEQGSTLISELIRFQRNRTDNVEKGSLAHFRNKVSSKVQINLDLMCDNQLDECGNFAWRQRAYHAKRLLGNFFEVVNPSNGYDKYITRRVPNGERKTAIGKLIISTNLDTFRQQMQGEPVDVMELSNECTSKIKGGYVYPCCCVTDDQGNPTKSGLRIPTKNHLVVGNSGDSKYVVMPQVTDEGMYCAREGYCHVNIFLAMLINVSESQAKDYTKMVRDLVMPKLGQWPTMLDVATLCYMLTVFFPDTQSAELPRILVDHKTKSMHVIDSFGSLSTGYHTLKANTVGQLVNFVNNDLESDMKFYRVGGLATTSRQEKSEDAALSLLIRGVYRPNLLKEVLEQDPILLLYALISPSVLLALHNSKSLEVLIQHFIVKDRSVSQLCDMLSKLARKVSVSKHLLSQHDVIRENTPSMLQYLSEYRGDSPSKSFTQAILQKMDDENKANYRLRELGFSTLQQSNIEIREKKYVIELKHSWRDLTLYGKFLSTIQSRIQCEESVSLANTEEKGTIKMWHDSTRSYIGLMTAKGKNMCAKGRKSVTIKCYEILGRIVCRSVSTIGLICPDLSRMVHILSVMFIILRIIHVMREHLAHHNKLRADKAMHELHQKFDRVQLLHTLWTQNGGTTEINFIEHLGKVEPELQTFYIQQFGDDEYVETQSKSKNEMQLEKIIAMMALILMVYDAERSDCVYKVLNKLKGIMGTLGTETVQLQSLDDIRNLMEEKKMTIDMEVTTDDHQINTMGGITFENWWQNQLENGRAIAHYRTEGHFMEFTRANAAIVAHNIDHGEHKDILIMGAVGSGKSTGLPFHLKSKGKVLIIEPTKPLAENVHKQLGGHPFLTQTTLKMRGHCVFGSSPITVMTSGYALHYYANNTSQLADYNSIIFDECHVHDASAMAFRCLLHEYQFGGKIIKVSATPPGHTPAFKTQYPVKVNIEESLSFQQFVQAQGTGVNADVITFGNNILVYVASYNEVDTLSKMLIDKGHKVTKVDGRTMKQGNVEVPTSGTNEKKHFIVATNIIENGVTLDVDVVVDFGLKVVPELDMDSKLIRYNKTAVSFGERIQRLGRVGRHKEGMALRIGSTEVGLSAVPPVIATEAAFYCFAYGLPVIASGVVTSALAKCTVSQARTMMHFELPIFYTKYLVRYDGTMHPLIHSKLAKFKLRDSEIVLNKLAIPSQGVKNWKTAAEYTKLGARVLAPEEVRIPFYTKDIPDRTHEEIWDVVSTHQADAGFGRISSVSACKVAYTLQTDVNAIQRTVCIIDALIANELRKREYFKNITSTGCSSSFSLVSITNAIRARHLTDHTSENIAVLQAARNQLLEFQNLNIQDPNEFHIRDLGALECVQFQSQTGVAKQLKLKGQWNKSLVTTDLIVTGATLIGGVWMAISYFLTASNEVVALQGSGKRSRQKLKFDKVRTMKKENALEVRQDEAAEHYFGEAYAKKNPKQGKTRGMGTKMRKFYNMYGFDPSEYNTARYVDPLTGYTLDESPITDLSLVQEHFGNIRAQMRMNDELSSQSIMSNPKLEVYLVKSSAKQMLKVDMYPHNPLLVCANMNTIAGFPERAYELRQTGRHQTLDISELPESKEYEQAELEGKAAFQGLRDYNPIATTVCMVTNESDGHTETMFGIGYGSFLITNQHLFKRNNGILKIQSHRGKFVVENTTQLQIYPFNMRDLVLVKLPKDFLPFPRRIRFRQPIQGERVCMVGSNFQDKSTTSTVSEQSLIARKDNSHFYRHWISTKPGQCGLPMVSTKDGSIVGIHGMASLSSESGFFISFPPDMEENYLNNEKALNWQKHWKINFENANWGAFNIIHQKPDKLFELKKDIFSLFEEEVQLQSTDAWLYKQLTGNLKAVARTHGQLVTKHVVKDKCLLFATYLENEPEEKAYFTPLMGAYQKSKLNKEAYVKDLFKYASDITTGMLDPNNFERAELMVEKLLRSVGFTTCDYVTDTNAIFNALNMKAAVGALYQGKKKDYFADFSDENKTEIIKQSCQRLYMGKMGVWNGSLKAELRTKEKVDQNKTRSFTAAPIDTLLGGKVCVDDFNNQFYELNLKGPWSVGMTKFYGGWDQLLQSLPDGWIYCDADGSQFDSSLTPYLINAVLNLRLKFMEKWDLGEVMLENLYTEIVYTPISTPDGTIIKKFKGNNSGQPSTVVDNTLMVILAMYYSSICYNDTTPLDSYCKFFVNGDDLLLAVRPDMEPFLDVLSNLFSHLGLKYEFSSRHKAKTDVWFMSHKGILYEDMYIPKLEEERIVSILEWDRAQLPEHRLEAICASMIEAWGYPDLLHRIRKFYSWVLDQAPYNLLAKEGKAAYISETALKTLYTNKRASKEELQQYLDNIDYSLFEGDECVQLQGEEKETLNAGESTQKSKDKEKVIGNRDESGADAYTPESSKIITTKQDKDVDAGSTGTFTVPKIKAMKSTLTLPRVKGVSIVNLPHLLQYEPRQTDLSNARSSHMQFAAWYNAVKESYGLDDTSMSVVMNGLMVWCIENGTSPNMNGSWTMMDGDEQVEYPLKPIVENAQPTLRQIMAHFSDLAEAYIEKRNMTQPYMPRYGMQRNLRDWSLARFAFDFYEMTSKTPVKAREAHMQMKAAALRNAHTRMFGLDGNVGDKEENTERHTTNDVNQNLHNMLGVRI